MALVKRGDLLTLLGWQRERQYVDFHAILTPAFHPILTPPVGV